MTPEQTKSAYQRVCEQECENCRTGYFRDQDGSHRVPETWGETSYEQCTAPSKDAFIERQAAQIAAMRAALAKGRQALYDIGFASALDVACTLENWRLTCDLATGAMLEIDAALSDDIERGKELLGQKELIRRFNRAFDRWCCGSEFHNEPERIAARMAEMVDGKIAVIRENQRQAVEIEELRKDKPRLDWLASIAEESFGDVEIRVPDDPAREPNSRGNLRAAIDAAMKEKL